MSEIKVNKISPKQTCTQLTLGDSGDTIIIPAGATIQNSGTATGFGATGAVNWDTTKKTSGFTAVSGVGYFCDTTSSAFTVTLPATPSAGAIVAVADYANTFATNNLTIARNGSNIGGIASNSIISTNGVSVTFVYVDATQGWIVTDSGNRSDLPLPAYVAATGGTICTSGDYKIHTFTGPGTFTVTNDGNPLGSSTVDYLVVAGGGGGANGDRQGGGGAGGFRESVPSPAAWTASPLANPGGALPVSVQGYPITVGGGGSGGSAGSVNKGGNGNPSIFSTITSAAGGGAGSTPGSTSGNSGGSGGGAGIQTGTAGTFIGGTGNTPPVNPSQGNSGGTAISAPSFGASAGGGGAGAAGSNSSGGTGGVGGAGVSTSITGSSVAYSGGGGSGGDAGPTVGGIGGGGNGKSACNPGTGNPGTINTGGGGGGTAYDFQSPLPAGASGGSGIVVIRYRFQ
jgi:hypothetical protein